MASSAAASSRRSYAKGAERRARIVTTALEVFSERGYGAASMREIAARSGLTQSGLLHHFTSKDELLIEVIELRDRRIDAALVELHVDTMRDRLVAVAEHNQRERMLSTVYTVLVADSVLEGQGTHDYFIARYRKQLEEVRQGLRDEIAAGRVRDTIDVDSMGAMLISILDGFLLQQEIVAGFEAGRMVGAVWDGAVGVANTRNGEHIG